VRIILILFSLFTTCTFACGGDAVNEFRPFAIEIKNHPNLKSYWVFFPDNDQAADKMYLSGISALIEGELALDLEYSKSEEYPSFYSALVSVKEDLIDKLVIVGTYNHTDSTGTGIALCGNWKNYQLKHLIINGSINV
jgi:hypothetical protein